MNNKPRRTSKGIIINQYLACTGTVHACYYRDGNYPQLIDFSDKKPINKWGTTKSEKWHHDLKNHKPDRVYDWID